MSVDFWTSDYEKAQNLLKAIQTEVNKSPGYHKSLSGTDIALTRGRVSQLNSLISQMKQSLALVSETREAGSAEKAAQLTRISQELERCKSSFYNAITSTPSTDMETGPESSHEEEMVVVKQQESQLDYILGTATNMKEIGHEINEEIGVHCRLLEDIEAREDEILEKQRVNERLLKDWIKSKNSSLGWLWGIVVFLFLTFIYVIMW